MNIQLPEPFQSKLQEDQFLDGAVKSTLTQFGDILKENKLYFFQEYTDHGLDHIEKVIGAAKELVTHHTMGEVLGSTDIAYYVLAVVLHDLGMHISVNGFVSLLDGAFDSARVKELDKKN